MSAAFGTGFATAFSLILAIGAQNAFVLRQGLLRQHVFWLCLLFTLSDALLITAGILGFDAVVQAWPSWPWIMARIGAVFLIYYGASKFRAAFSGTYEMELSGKSAGLRETLLIGLAFTWLNPHVYLDTLGLIGAISTRFDGQAKWAFGTGAVLASFVFFFSLGYGARILAPLMRSARAWRVFDVLVGCTMWVIAAGLLFS